MEEEGDEARGFDAIRRIFDEDEEDEEEKEERNSSKSFDGVELRNNKPEDPKSDNGPIMQR